MQGKLDHIVLNVKDENLMLEFYGNVLELKPERVDDFKAGKAPFPSVRLNDSTIIDLFPKKIWSTGAEETGGTPNLNHFCLALTQSELTRLVARLERNRTPIDVGPVPRWGAKGAGTSVYFKDPEGNVVEARYYDKPDPAQDRALGS